MRRCVFLVVFALLLPSLNFANTRGISITAKDLRTGQPGEVQLYRKTFAVIVGIDSYKNLPPDKQLKNAVNDARGVEEVLRRNYRFDEVVTLFDEQATKENVMRLLTAELPTKMTEDDALFLFWAGHGNQQKSALGEIGYLIPYDGSADAVYKDITMAELRDTVSKLLPAKHVFYVMDACYSGLLTTTRSLNDKPQRDLAYLKEITKESVRQVLTAGGKGEEALDGGPKGHSVFTGRLIEALEAAGDFVTANEIQAILREKVFQDARARNHSQTPGFGTLYGSGDFVFVPNVEQKVADVAAEVAKAEAELAAIQAREDAAKKAQNEMERRAAERERQVAEAKLRAEKLRQEQLAEEARRQEEQRTEQQLLVERAKQQEEALAAQRSEEVQRLAQLKAEIEAKRAQAPVASTATIEQAVAEIRRLSKEIETIEAAFEREQKAGEGRIEKRYASLLAEISAQEKAAKGKPLVQDMFETDAEFVARKKNAGKVYTERRKELERQKHVELDELASKSSFESKKQTAKLRRDLANLAKKEFSFDPKDLAFEVGRYDINSQSFPFTLSNKAIGENVAKPLVKVAINGTIRMKRDEAKEWYGHLQNGFVRPEVTAKPDGEVVQVAFIDDVSEELLLTLDNGKFVTVRAKRERELGELVGEMVEVLGGCYQMGDIFSDGSSDEKPVHEVCVSDFVIGKTEVTQAQWRKVMGYNPSTFSNCGDDCPVEMVSWFGVEEFLGRLNQQTGKNFRLPTEAEWEYAARSGGKSEKYSGGDNVDAVSWYVDNSDRTHPVGQKAANGLGLYDMTGNVNEWCQDRYDSNYYGKSSPQNPQGPSRGAAHVARGGSFRHDAEEVRVSCRYEIASGERSNLLGFRLAHPVVQ